MASSRAFVEPSLNAGALAVASLFTLVACSGSSALEHERAARTAGAGGRAAGAGGTAPGNAGSGAVAGSGGRPAGGAGGAPSFAGRGGSGGNPASGGNGAGGREHTAGGANDGGSGDEPPGTGGTLPGSSGSSDASGGMPTAGTAGASPFDVCRADPGGPDFDDPGPYELGTSLSTCLSGSNDVDYYSFTTPDAPAGGYVTVTVSGIKALGNQLYANELVVSLYAGTDTFAVTSFQNDQSEDQITFWFGAVPSTTYRLRVDFQNHTPSVDVAYTLGTEYHLVPDPFEPNQTNDDATRIEPGVPTQAYLTAGYTSSSSPGGLWWDTFVVTLGDGAATVRVSDVPSDPAFELYMYGPAEGSSQTWAYAEAVTANTELSVTTDPSLPAGDYYLQLEPTISSTEEFGAGTTPADNFTHPYTVTVMQ